ncbi:helix-turn-helix domain-containing protein [Saccharicrinis sp. GN24d3]|uniref:helix-turn-helix domain-containing protein n=1 Tax=Saccharicrinis sp. GN24d3 TaxID=3458416 RepID=UPI004035342B
MEVILISSIFLSFFIVFLLLTKKQKVLTDRILVIWFVIIGIHLLGFYFNQKGYWEIFPHLVGITAPMPLLHGPMLFLYTLYSLRNDRKIRAIDYLHLIPALASYLYMLPFFFFYSVEEKRMVDNGKIQDYSVFSIVLLVAILISGLIYSILSYRLTTKHQNKIDNYFSYSEGINIKWLRNCILSIGLVFFSATIIYILRDALGIQFPFNVEYIIYLIIIGFVFYIGYFGIKQENIFTNNPTIKSAVEGVSESSKKYKNSGLKSEDITELYKNLLKTMVDDKPYLDSKLSLSELAQILKISPNQLSQIINQEAKVNFHDFVNNYRVEEFIQKASENKNFSLLALALDSGFNSKSSFNTIFKKQKGITPSQYLSKQVQKDLKT